MTDADTLPGITRHVEIGGLDFYIHLAERDNNLDTILMTISRVNADYSHFSRGIAELINLLIKYNVPLSEIVSRLKYIRGETGGLTNDSQIPMASSILDYIARMLEERYLDKENSNAIDTNFQV